MLVTNSRNIEELVIPPEKRQETLNELIKFIKIYKVL